MIVFPMLGKSSRFFNAGYKKPKFQLALGNETVFKKVVRSFDKYFDSRHFLFLVREDFSSKDFISNELQDLGIKDYRIKTFAEETLGQADSVIKGTLDYSGKTSILIFNIDTIRKNFIMPGSDLLADGFLEVFKGDGNSWSFVEPGPDSIVLRTTEKDRISELCSNGLYGFKNLSDLRDSFYEVERAHIESKTEIYIAPLYNQLINSGKTVKYRLVDQSNIEHCGIPEDYEHLKSKYT